MVKISFTKKHNFLCNGWISDCSQSGNPGHYHNIITHSFYQPGPRPLREILLQSFHNVLSNVANRQTTKAT